MTEDEERALLSRVDDLERAVKAMQAQLSRLGERTGELDRRTVGSIMIGGNTP